MRRFIPLVSLFVLFLTLTVTGSPIAPRTRALYNHPSLSDAMVEVRTVRTFLPMTAFEREVRARSVFGYHVPSVHLIQTVDDWVSPHEGNIVLIKPEGRWHNKVQRWRRMS